MSQRGGSETFACAPVLAQRTGAVMRFYVAESFEVVAGLDDAGEVIQAFRADGAHALVPKEGYIKSAALHGEHQADAPDCAPRVRLNLSKQLHSFGGRPLGGGFAPEPDGNSPHYTEDRGYGRNGFKHEAIFGVIQPPGKVEIGLPEEMELLGLLVSPTRFVRVAVRAGDEIRLHLALFAKQT